MGASELGGVGESSTKGYSTSKALICAAASCRGEARVEGVRTSASRDSVSFGGSLRLNFRVGVPYGSELDLSCRREPGSSGLSRGSERARSWVGKGSWNVVE